MRDVPHPVAFRTSVAITDAATLVYRVALHQSDVRLLAVTTSTGTTRHPDLFFGWGDGNILLVVHQQSSSNLGNGLPSFVPGGTIGSPGGVGGNTKPSVVVPLGTKPQSIIPVSNRLSTLRIKGSMS